MAIKAKISELVMARAEKGWTQKELAERAGVSRATICKIEAGSNADVMSAKKISDSIGSPVSDLFEIAARE